MTPMLFGPPARRLFGLFHPPEREGRIAVLICAPFGQEVVRSHRLFRVLSDRLARTGIAVLRFDPYGTGDSPGEDIDGELEGWRRDVCTAHEELHRLTTPRRIVWLGSRLGATVATMATRSGRCDPSRLILWDPIVDGARYFNELRENHVAALEQSYWIADRTWRRRLRDDSESFTDELIGFGVSPALRDQLRGLTPQSLRLTGTHETVVLAKPEDNLALQWAHAEAERDAKVKAAPFQHSLIWTSDPFPNSAMVPAEALQRLLAEIND